MNPYPLKLTPVVKSALWGGERLRRDWRKQSDLQTIAETWELTVREREVNTVQNGAFAGKTLKQVLAQWGNTAIGANFENDRFPLLVKFIDAADRLSVQVHPDDAFAHTVEGDLGKTEMWYIVQADTDAEILLGLIPGATTADFAQAAANGNVQDVLRRVKVKQGDCFFIPAGMPHAIGAGILVAEIQQNCDLTYRVFDYNRRDSNGCLRELHIDKALQVTRPFTADEVERVRFAKGRADDALLAACPYFTVRHLSVTDEIEERTLADSFHSLLFLAGEGVIEASGVQIPYRKGDSFFVPAGMGSYRICGNGELLLSTL